MPKPSGLRIEPRFDKTGKANGFTIAGYVAGQRVRQRAQSSDAKLAKKEAALLEAEILNTAWHGERRGTRLFAEAALSYLEAAPRSEHTKHYVTRILLALGDKVTLNKVNQDAAIRLRRLVLPENAKNATYTRQIVTPLRAILRHAAGRGWCDLPIILAPKAAQGRTRYLLPDQAERLIGGVAAHLKPVLIFLLGTGARIGETIYLDWQETDLNGARAIFWPDQTKTGKRRNAYLPPRVVAALANLPHRDGPVFLSDKGRPYADRRGAYGGQIKTGFKGAVRRTGLDPALTVHDLRHTWASWHYAVHRDLIALQQEGGWSSVVQVTRYAHLLPQGYKEAICASLGAKLA
jgi:integrase